MLLLRLLPMLQPLAPRGCNAAVLCCLGTCRLHPVACCQAGCDLYGRAKNDGGGTGLPHSRVPGVGPTKLPALRAAVHCCRGRVCGFPASTLLLALLARCLLQRMTATREGDNGQGVGWGLTGLGQPTRSLSLEMLLLSCARGKLTWLPSQPPVLPGACSGPRGRLGRPAASSVLQAGRRGGAMHCTRCVRARLLAGVAAWQQPLNVWILATAGGILLHGAGRGSWVHRM